MTHLPCRRYPGAARHFVVAAGPRPCGLPAMITVLSAELAAAPSSSDARRGADDGRRGAVGSTRSARPGLGHYRRGTPERQRASTAGKQRDRDWKCLPRITPAANCSAARRKTRIFRTLLRVIPATPPETPNAWPHCIASPDPSVAVGLRCRCDRPAPESIMRAPSESRRSPADIITAGRRTGAPFRFDASDSSNQPYFDF